MTMLLLPRLDRAFVETSTLFRRRHLVARREPGIERSGSSRCVRRRHVALDDRSNGRRIVRRLVSTVRSDVEMIQCVCRRQPHHCLYVLADSEALLYRRIGRNRLLQPNRAGSLVGMLSSQRRDLHPVIRLKYLVPHCAQ